MIRTRWGRITSPRWPPSQATEGKSTIRPLSAARGHQILALRCGFSAVDTLRTQSHPVIIDTAMSQDSFSVDD
jgi:hypothetical protein